MTLRECFEQLVREQCDIPYPEYYRMGDTYNRPDLATKWRWYSHGTAAPIEIEWPYCLSVFGGADDFNDGVAAAKGALAEALEERSK